MIRTVLKLKKSILNYLLAILILILLQNHNWEFNASEFYNEIFIQGNQNLLSKDSTRLIILTVTGNQEYNSSRIKELYKKLQIIHLLVLSGSNIAIICVFLSYFKSRNQISYIYLYILALLYYFCFINFLHPVARALIFYTLYEFNDSMGIKIRLSQTIILISAVSSCTYYLLRFSDSFLLSYLFSMLIILYGFIEKILEINNKLISKYLLFPIYITFSSYPISLYFFHSYYPVKSLISNLLIVPFYDYVVLILYFCYFIGFTPISYYFFSFLNYLILSFLDYLTYINYLYNI